MKEANEKAEAEANFAALSSLQLEQIFRSDSFMNFESFRKVTSGSGSESLIGLRSSEVSTRALVSASAFSQAFFKAFENMQWQSICCVDVRGFGYCTL